MLSYQCGKSHCGNKTIVRLSYLRNGISYTGEMASLYWIGAQGLFHHLLRHLYYKISQSLKDWMLESSNCFEIWLASQQQWCLPISKWVEDSKHQSHTCKTLREFTLRHLTWYWSGPNHCCFACETSQNKISIVINSSSTQNLTSYWHNSHNLFKFR